jgi:hypothetical protein
MRVEQTVRMRPSEPTVQCSAVQCSAVQCSGWSPQDNCRVIICGDWGAVAGATGLLCCVVQCSAVQCSAVQCSVVQCSAVQCSAVRPGLLDWVLLEGFGG